MYAFISMLVHSQSYSGWICRLATDLRIPLVSGDRSHEKLHVDWLATSLPPRLPRPQPSTSSAGPSGQLGDHISKLKPSDNTLLIVCASDQTHHGKFRNFLSHLPYF